jgi:sugar/nucleoside kinase (ribokinase family)
MDLQVESTFSENIACIGQAGGYTSLGYARLGKSVAFIGYVGEDHDGRHILTEFRREGIDVSALRVDPAGTSRSVNIMGSGGGRRTFYDGKSHLRLHPDLTLCTQLLSGGARLAHFHLPNWARELLPAARRLGLKIATDLQDIMSAEDVYRRDFLEASEILFFSSVNQREPLALLEALTTRFPEKLFIAGMAERGCAVGRQGTVEAFPPVRSSLPLLDTNGAGDALAVGFLTSFVLDRYTLHESILRGQIAARHACAQRGTSSTLITMAQLDHRYATLLEVPS